MITFKEVEKILDEYGFKKGEQKTFYIGDKPMFKVMLSTTSCDFLMFSGQSRPFGAKWYCYDFFDYDNAKKIVEEFLRQAMRQMLDP